MAEPLPLDCYHCAFCVIKPIDPAPRRLSRLALCTPATRRLLDISALFTTPPPPAGV